MTPIFHLFLTLEVAAGMGLPSPRNVPPAGHPFALTRAALRPVAMLESQARAPAAVIGASIDRASASRPLPTYQPAPEEWLNDFAGRLDMTDARATRAARSVAAFPLGVDVHSNSVSMRLTLRNK